MRQVIWDGARRAIETLYEDTCRITIYDAAEDGEGITKTAERTLYEALPCRLSFSSSPASSDGVAPAVSQSVKLFLPPDAAVPPGCRIEVTRGGRVTAYRSSGMAARYPTHQEISLEAYEETP